MDWIDEEKRRRDQGINTPLLPGQHEAVNARYSGCTLEHCCECGSPTGRAGRGDDSIYIGDYGPLCKTCRDCMCAV